MIYVDSRKAIKELKWQFDKLSWDNLQKGIKISLNESMKKGRSKMIDLINLAYDDQALTATGIRKKLIIQNATERKLVAILKIDPSKIPLVYFRPRQTGAGVQVQVRKGRTSTIRSAFIRKVGKGNENTRGKKHVLAKGKYESNSFQFRTKRVRPYGQNDLPITALVSISLPQALFSEDNRIVKRAADHMDDQFYKRLSHTLGFLSGAGR